MVVSGDQLQSTLVSEETLEKAPEQSKLVKDENKFSEEDGSGKEEHAGGSSSNGKVGDKQEQDSTKSLALANEFFEKGCKAIEENNIYDSVDFCSRALEIRVLHYGELAPECTSAYYKYGCALLFKAQDEADPLGCAVSKGSQKDLTKSKTAQESRTSKISQEGSNQITSEEGDEEIGEGIDDEEVTHMEEGDEDDSDLHLAWSMLDIARSIDEKHCKPTLDTVKILSALGDVSLEREDFETCLSDYNKALSIIGNLEAPDHRRAIDLNFRICMALEVAERIQESIPYCEKAIALSKSCSQRLKEEIVIDSKSALEDAAVSCRSQEEVEVVSGFQIELERKLEDLQQALSNPKPLLSRDQKKVQPSEKLSTKVEGRLTNSSQDGESHSSFDQPTISATATNASVTHLGVIGRGVKRATIAPIAMEPAPKRIVTNMSSAESVATKKEEIISTSQDVETGK
ncbi:TPR domain containing protein [Zostera marina]|uniref:TPR domain containing protein n=1 Tax=Zostera marina TaxID=29655 RepID=A0A0K9P490_ZOSMR|nr:TPR domain containing protein [Zostera marina]